MEFSWDPEKARTNLAKHGVSFELAREVWDDPFCVVIPDRVEGGEERWQAFGLVGSVVILAVAHAYPDPAEEGQVRIISARKATPYERRRYEQEGS